MGPGMISSGNAGPSPNMMMRMIFTLMDSDGDGTVSLEEFQTAHERIFKGMDANRMAASRLRKCWPSCRGPGI